MRWAVARRWCAARGSLPSEDFGRYIELLAEAADWLAQRGINPWRSGSFRLSTGFFAESLSKGEVQLAFSGEALVGTLRLLLREPILWPEAAEDEGRADRFPATPTQ